MEDAVQEHIIQKILDAPLDLHPYPHLILEHIFPDGFYEEMLATLPSTQNYESLSKSGAVRPGTYQQRYVIKLEDENLRTLPFSQYLFWREVAAFFNSQTWISTLLKKFDLFIEERFGEKRKKLLFFSDAGLVRDHTHYSIGPHTDHPWRVLTFLFYLPKNKDQADLGTSIYSPIDPTFSCDGQKHHSYDRFSKVKTAPFHPNTLFGFFRSAKSYHGVEPIKKEGIERNTLSYSLLWELKE